MVNTINQIQYLHPRKSSTTKPLAACATDMIVPQKFVSATSIIHIFRVSDIYVYTRLRRSLPLRIAICTAAQMESFVEVGSLPYAASRDLGRGAPRETGQGLVPSSTNLSCVVLVALFKGSRGAPSKSRAVSHGTGYDLLRISPHCRRPAHIRPSPAAHQGAETKLATRNTCASSASQQLKKGNGELENTAERAERGAAA